MDTHGRVQLLASDVAGRRPAGPGWLVGGDGSGRRARTSSILRQRETVYQLAYPGVMVRDDGIEPPTARVWNGRSTAELVAQGPGLNQGGAGDDARACDASHRTTGRVGQPGGCTRLRMSGVGDGHRDQRRGGWECG